MSLPAAAALFAALMMLPPRASANTQKLPVQLLPFDCVGITDADVRAPLAAQLKERVIPVGGKMPAEFVAVMVICRGTDVRISAAHPGAEATPLHQTSLGDGAPATRARVLAVAIADAVGSRGEAAPDTRRSPTPTSPFSSPPSSSPVGPSGSPAPSPSRFWMHQEFGPLVGTNLSGAAYPLLGVQARIAGIFVRRSEARWAFGFALDTTFAGISRSDKFLSLIGLGLGGVARRGGARWSSEFALGTRVAALMVEDGQGINIYKDFVLSPFGVAALECRLTQRLSARAAVEMGAAAVTPDATLDRIAGSDGDRLVGGAWTLFLLGLSVRYF